MLVGLAGRLVTKDDLMKRVWPGAVVEDNTVHAHIPAIRKALGADRGMLKTGSGRGYRLIEGLAQLHAAIEGFGAAFFGYRVRIFFAELAQALGRTGQFPEVLATVEAAGRSDVTGSTLRHSKQPA